MRCFVYIVCPAVLNCSSLKHHQTLEMKNIFKQEKIVLQLTFNPGLTLTGFRTTRPRVNSASPFAKKRTRPISSHLDRINFVNKGFIIWLLGKLCLRDTAGSPERARWLHLARSGSQSQRAILFILPARGASHIIKIIYYTEQPTITTKK